MTDKIFDYSTLKCRQLMIDLKCRKVTIGHREISLSTREFDLLFFLANHPGWVFSHEELYQFVWKQEPVDCKNSVTCCIYQIRKKIELNPRRPQYIHTVRDIGYKFELLPEK